MSPVVFRQGGGCSREGGRRLSWIWVAMTWRGVVREREREGGLRETLGFGSGSWDSHWCLSHNKVRTKQYFLTCQHLARFSLSRDLKCIRNKWQTNVNGSIKAPRYITWHSRIIIKDLECQIFHGFSQISQEALLSCSSLPCACIDATVGPPPSVVITLCKVAKRQHICESSPLVHHVLLVVPSSNSCGRV